MLDHTNHYQAGGDSSYPIARPDREEGNPKTVIGSSVTFGTIVVPAFTDSDPLFDAGRIDGPTSPMMTVELADAGTGQPNARALIYGVVQSQGTTAQNGTAKVLTKGVTCKARVLIADGGHGVLTPLMHDTASPGRLILYDGTGKCIALLAQKVNDPGASAEEQLQYVHFNGIEGFGGAIS